MTRPAPPHPRRIVYLGTPEVAVPPLEALHGAGYEIPLVVTRADKRRGRGGASSPSPVKEAALSLGIPVTTKVADAAAVGADLGVVVAFGRLIKPQVLDLLPMVNLHFSLLPRWRGAAPLERAILEGDPETGICLMAVEEGLDTGGVYKQVTLPLSGSETLAELQERMASRGAVLLLEALEEGLGKPSPQVGEPTYAAKIEPGELCLDWAEPAARLQRVVRLGGAWTTFRGKRLKVHQVTASEGDVPGEPGTLDGERVATGSGALQLVEVQPEGKARLSAAAWLNGARPTPGERLGG